MAFFKVKKIDKKSEVTIEFFIIFLEINLGQLNPSYLTLIL